MQKKSDVDVHRAKQNRRAMDGLVDGRKYGSVHGWMGGWMDRRESVGGCGKDHGRMDGWVDVWMVSLVDSAVGGRGGEL